MAANQLGNLTDSSMKNLKTLIDSNTVIGQAVNLPDGTMILPVSKVAFGFGVGGGDLPASQKELFGGGTGAGVTITPMGFLVIREGEVKLLQLQSFHNTADRMVGMVPEVMDKVSGLFSGGKKGGDAPEAPASPEKEP